MKNGNTPAMPIEFNGFGQYAPEAYSGMTKREMIAMHVMQGLCSSDIETLKVYLEATGSDDVGGLLARMSTEYADNLLKELESNND